MPTDSTKSGFSGTSSTSEERSRRRSERVVLCVPILLSARILHGRRISIDAKSLVVNAHRRSIGRGAGIDERAAHNSQQPDNREGCDWQDPACRAFGRGTILRCI